MTNHHKEPWLNNLHLCKVENFSINRICQDVRKFIDCVLFMKTQYMYSENIEYGSVMAFNNTSVSGSLVSVI